MDGEIIASKRTQIKNAKLWKQDLAYSKKVFEGYNRNKSKALIALSNDGRLQRTNNLDQIGLEIREPTHSLL